MSAGTWSAWGSACRSRGICLGRDISARTLVWNPFLAKHDAKTSSIFFPQLSPILRSFKEKLRCQPPPLEYDAIEEVHLHLSCLNNSLSMWCSPPQHTIWRPGNFHMVQLLCLGSTMIPKKTKLAKLMSCIIYFFTRWFIFSPSSPSSLPLLLFLQKNPFGFRCRAPPPKPSVKSTSKSSSQPAKAGSHAWIIWSSATNSAQDGSLVSLSQGFD